MPDRDLPNLERGRSVADACKDARIPRERHETPNPRYLPGRLGLFRSCHPIPSI